MTTLLIAAMTLGWTGLSLSLLAMVFRRGTTPRLAAWRAFWIGLCFNGASAWFAAAEAPWPATLLVLACHLLILPLLLAAARREPPSPD